ncbi:MAG: ferrous iron transport protein B [Tissierella sp.]|nr:ferrous iron transport protein B [Tissierella sp.]
MKMYEVKLESPDDIVIALAGNPNTGKSTVFNSLTGLNQHTGNWPGKTVSNAQGKFTHKDKKYILVDLPGTYSLLSSSVEEEIARDFICFGNPNVTIVVTDATCLERNLNLALQIMEITNNVIICVNLMDEAKRKNMSIDIEKLSNLLGVPVVATTARSGDGLDDLKNMVEKVANGEIIPTPKQISYDEILETAIKQVQPYVETIADNLNSKWVSLRLIDNDQSLINSMNNHINYNFSDDKLLQTKLDDVRAKLESEGYQLYDLRDQVVSSIFKTAEYINNQVLALYDESYNKVDYKIDRILTSRIFGIPIMIALLGLVFWLTIEGANYPSMMLADGLFYIQDHLTSFFTWLGTPIWVHDILILGIYRTLAWVISVMLPPMAIFFPLFTLLEDLGYLPRIAFNLDYYFKKACAHGKQALTMCMGFGCNAAGVIACRIIDSPREQLIAIITNNFVPCNGRFPTLIVLSSIFIAGAASTSSSIAATLFILLAIVMSVIITLFISKILSKTILKGLPSSFILELPPYRKPQVGKIIIHSIFDRTLFVLGRAVMVAAPAGLVIWLMANITVGNFSLLTHCALFLDPFSRLLGLDGYIMMAFILGLPANEIVIPILIMSYTSKGAILELSSLTEMGQLFVENGWTWLTAVCMMIFSLNHWPCGTTLLTIKKETQSWKWTWISFIVPTLTGIILCFIVAQGARLLGLA